MDIGTLALSRAGDDDGRNDGSNEEPHTLLVATISAPAFPAEEDTAIPMVVTKRPDLIPEWVPKLQWVASGAALFFAAVAIVVERHEQRYHHGLPDDEK
jgi:hypothetical protein